MSEIKIGNHVIGPKRCFVIAEAGVNHNGILDLAVQLVDIASHAGADAVKFQTYNTDRVAVKDAPKAKYQKETTGSHETQWQMLKKLELSSKDHRTLQAYCQKKDILFLSSPFDEGSADFLETLGVPAFKIPSGEITNLPFIEHVARKKKPMIVSTGMSTLTEVRTAKEIICNAGNDKLVLLHCISAYPAVPEDANLLAMQTMAKDLGVPVGFSDHTLGLEVALAAVALGACVIEKHFTTNRHLSGPDHRSSLEPPELNALIKSIRNIEAALGHGRKEPAPCEEEIAFVSRKSMVSACDVPAGTVITKKLIAMKSPGNGLQASMLDQIVGRVAAQDIPADTPLTKELLR